jgi:hypothetical protein
VPRLCITHLSHQGSKRVSGFPRGGGRKSATLVRPVELYFQIAQLQPITGVNVARGYCMQLVAGDATNRLDAATFYARSSHCPFRGFLNTQPQDPKPPSPQPRGTPLAANTVQLLQYSHRLALINTWEGPSHAPPLHSHCPARWCPGHCRGPSLDRAVEQWSRAWLRPLECYAYSRQRSVRVSLGKRLGHLLRH